MSPIPFAALAPVGVKAVVSDVGAFMAGIKQINKGIQSVSDMAKKVISIALIPFNAALRGVGKVFSWLGGTIQRIVEYAFGYLLGNAIRDMIQWFKDLVGEIISAGDEFQLLSLRLRGINFQTAIDSGLAMADAFRQAEAATKDQLTWLQALSAATPFNAEDIAQTYTLARSLGFTDDEARSLTKDITDFTAAMGLSSDTIERVLYNFAQMRQRGKVTMTEIRDLARGALLPISVIYERMAKNMGITVQALQKAISKPGGGVDPQEFIDAFQQMVKEEPRFVGAAGRMARTFQGATNNIVDLFRSIGGLNTVKPVLDAIGDALASIIDEFVYFNAQGDMIRTEKWDQLVKAAERLGKAISAVVSDLLEIVMPAQGTFADTLILGLDKISMWFEDSRSTIASWASNAIAEISRVWEWLFGTPGQTSDRGDGSKQRQKLGFPMGYDTSRGMPLSEYERLYEGISPSGAMGGVDKIFMTDPKQGALGKFISWLSGVAIPKIREGATAIYENIILPFLNKPAGEWQALFLALSDTVSALSELGSAIWMLLQDIFGLTPNTTFTDWLNNDLNPGIKKLSDWITENQGSLERFAWLIIGIGASLLITSLAVMAIQTAIAALWGAIMGTLLTIFVTGTIQILQWIYWLWTEFKKFAAWFVDTYGPDISEAWRLLKEDAIDTWNSIIGLINDAILAIDTFLQKLGIAGSLGAGALLPLMPEGSGAVPGEKSRQRGAVTSSQSVANNTFNMTVNTAARTSTVISDFGMMQSMVG